MEDGEYQGGEIEEPLPTVECGAYRTCDAAEVKALHAVFDRPEWFAALGRDAIYQRDLDMQTATDLLIRDASARCAAVVLRLAGRRWPSRPEADQPTEIPASQAELAMLCNVSRNTFSRVVKAFASRRLVTLGYGSLTVNDPVRLRALADGG